MLQNKNIIVGVTGSIAAYKAASLVRLLVKAGANVQVVMTDNATSFITPLTLSTLSKKPVLVSYADPATGSWNNHVELGLWADMLVIAPATANTIAKMAHGICDNLLMAVYLSAKCPVYFAPAMDLDMFKHQATVQNVKTLQQYGNILIPAETGELASGLYGEGRMAEPEQITALLDSEIKKKQLLTGRTIMVTAGPTYEAIDPVRFIGNHSSGKMGFAIAEELVQRGANVKLICGPTAQRPTLKGITIQQVTSAAQMLKACIEAFKHADACIMSAAVADYTPVEVAPQKIKKQDSALTIELRKTTDILKTLGEQKRSGQILIGFALETENEEHHAIEKLNKKNLDAIVLNSLNDAGAGFATDTNKITIIDRAGKKDIFTLKSKKEVAADICNKLEQLMGI